MKSVHVAVSENEVGPGISDQFRRVFMSALSSSMTSDPSYWPPPRDSNALQASRGTGSARTRDNCASQPAEGVAMVGADVMVSDLDADSTMDLTGPYSTPEVCDALNPYALFNLPRPHNAPCCSSHEAKRGPGCRIFRDRCVGSGCHSSGHGPWRVRDRQDGGRQASGSSGEAFRGERDAPLPQRPFLPFDFPSDLTVPASHPSSRHQDVIAKSRTLPPTSLVTWTSRDGGDGGVTPMEAEPSEATSPTCMLLPGPCKKKCTGKGRLLCGCAWLGPEKCQKTE